MSDTTLKSVPRIILSQRSEVICDWILKGMEITAGCVFCHTFLLQAPRNHLNQEMKFSQPHVGFFSVPLLTLSFHYKCWSFCLSLGRLSSLQLIPLCSSLLALCNFCFFFLLYHYFFCSLWPSLETSQNGLKRRSIVESISIPGSFH